MSIASTVKQQYDGGESHLKRQASSSAGLSQQSLEMVSARERNFQMKEKWKADHLKAHGMDSVPLLLKPNGAPVFPNIDDGSGLNTTVKRGSNSGQINDLERTVKAHSFQVGKAITNQTSITVLDAQKNSAAQEQHFPVKVLYVKPSIVKRSRTSQQDLSKKGENQQKGEIQYQSKMDLDRELEHAVSLGEVSGIFKHDRIPTRIPKPQRAQSSKITEREKRDKAKKEYSELVRQQAKQKESLRQLQKAQEATVKDVTASADNEIEDDDMKQTLKPEMPFSQNRFKGEFQSMTKTLFKRAQQQVKLEKDQEKSKQEEAVTKREQEKDYLNQIKDRNMQILKEQKERGVAPPGSLAQKQRENEEWKHRQEVREDNLKRRELRVQRLQESRQSLGLDQADRSKLIQLAFRKKRESMEREDEIKRKEVEARQKLRKAEAKKLDLHQKAINRDLIDFTDGNGLSSNKKQNKKLQEQTEDDIAEPVVDKKAILQEQIEKRRQKERLRKEEEMEKQLRKEYQMRQLEETLRQQREEISRKQQQNLEKQKRAEAERAKQVKSKKNTLAMIDRPAQLNELRDWIDDQMKLDEMRSKAAKTIDHDALPKKKLASKSRSPVTQQEMQQDHQRDPFIAKYELPGNSLMTADQERMFGARQNRYGVNGDNGFYEIVQEQASKEGISLSKGEQDVLDFVQSESSPQKSLISEESLDTKPVRDGSLKRKIINQPLPEQMSPQKPPGVMNIQSEAAKQKNEYDQKREQAAITIQRRARGWQDRMEVNKLKSRINRQMDDGRADFIQQYRSKDQYNIDRFIAEKQRLRRLNKTEAIDESISENIGDSNSKQELLSGSFGRSQPATGSYDQSRQMPMVQNLIGYGGRTQDKDPNSLIALFIKQKIGTDIVVQDFPVKDRSRSRGEQRVHRSEKRGSVARDESSKRRRSSKSKEYTKSPKGQRRKQSMQIEDEIPIDSDIEQEKESEYSSHFDDGHISESIASFKQQSSFSKDMSQAREALKQDSSEILESIQESQELAMASQQVKKNQKVQGNVKRAVGQKKFQMSGTHGSIAEESYLKKEESIQSASIDDEIPDEVAQSKVDDDISEESFLKGSSQKIKESIKQSTGDQNKNLQSLKKPKKGEAVSPIPKKSERIVEAIEDDFDNNGEGFLKGGLKAEELRIQQAKIAEQEAYKYRMSHQIIYDYEEKQKIGTTEHERLMNGLAEEMKRYEAAVSGSIFVEQFQSIVEKSLAKRDMMMIGQRLSQMEQEKKHHQEIAAIRAEQVKMLSQLMLLQAGNTGIGAAGSPNKKMDPELIKQQQDILKSIQQIVDKPIVIQKNQEMAEIKEVQEIQESQPKVIIDQVDPSIDESIAEYSMSKKSNSGLKASQKLQQSMGLQQSGKYTSIDQSYHQRFSNDAHSKIEESIADDIGSEIAESIEEIDESIKMSIQQSNSQQKQLSNARKYFGSEKRVIDESKNIINDKQIKEKESVFDKNSFQDYTKGKFKDMLKDEGNQMEKFLDQIESAVTKKSEQEKDQLQKQLDNREISMKAFNQKKNKLEKWVQSERKEIQMKRHKVKDTQQDLSEYMQKIGQDKKMMLEHLSDKSTPRKNGLRRSMSGMSQSNSLKQVREQLHDIQEGIIGDEMPETKYLNKKRDYVRKLMKEKNEAIERGVQEKIGNLESEMIDEAMQQALNLDVDDEVNKRVNRAKRELEQNRLGEESIKSQTMPGRGNRKNVKFQSPQKQMSSSYTQSAQSPPRSNSTKSKKDKSHKSGISESINEDFVEESIQIGESIDPSSASASRLKKSDVLSSSKLSKSKGKKDKIPEVNVKKEEESDINSREDDIDEYSNDFVSESIHSESLRSEKGYLQSAQGLKNKAQNIEESGYSEAFEEEISIGQSHSKKLEKSQKAEGSYIEQIPESDEDQPDSSNLASKENERELQSNSKLSESGKTGSYKSKNKSSPEEKRSSLKKKKKQQEKAAMSEPPVTESDLTDKEMMETTQSVQWQVELQERVNPEAEASDSYYQEQEEEVIKESEKSQEIVSESIVEEEISSETVPQGIEDLESFPSKSQHSQSIGASMNDKLVDIITEELLADIIGNFEDDNNVKCDVEDEFDEEEWEDKWPFILDKIAQQQLQEEEQQFKKPVIPQIKEKTEEEKAEANQELESKKKHDEAMKKFHDEQSMLQEQRNKVIEYIKFITEIVEKEVLMQALQRPIEHDPLKILERIQAFDTEDEQDITSLAYSQQQSALPPYLFDEIEKRWEEIHTNEDTKKDLSQDQNVDLTNISQEAKNIHHLAIFDAFNEALDIERPYKIKGMPHPWSKQTRVTNEGLSFDQLDGIIKRAQDRVIEWDKTSAGTKFAPPPPPPPPASEQYDSPNMSNQETEEDRNKAERQERLGHLLTKEVHQREEDWLDYEIEDTQVRFDLADMILEELADEVTQFLYENQESRGKMMNY